MGSLDNICLWPSLRVLFCRVRVRVQNSDEKWGFAIFLCLWREYPKLLSVRLENVPYPLQFTKPSCECSLFTAEVEEICEETVAVNMQVFLAT